jgi:hypothetical protein
LTNLVLVVNGLDVLDLILPADGEEVQQYVLAEVDRDRGLHRVGDLLVLGADVMGFTIGHRHMDPLEGKKKKIIIIIFLPIIQSSVSNLSFFPLKIPSRVS